MDSPRVAEEIEVEISRYFQQNQDTAPDSIIWESFKAYVHGILIFLRASMERARDLAQSQFVTSIQELDDEHKNNSSPKTLENVNAKQRELELLDTQRIARNNIFAE